MTTKKSKYVVHIVQEKDVYVSASNEIEAMEKVINKIGENSSWSVMDVEPVPTEADTAEILKPVELKLVK